MLGELRYSGTLRLRLSQIASLVLHAAVCLIFIWPETPVFVRLSEVAQGEGGSSTVTSIYLPRSGFEDLTPAPGADIPNRAARRHNHKKPKQEAKRQLPLPSPTAPPLRAAEDQTS